MAERRDTKERNRRTEAMREAEGRATEGVSISAGVVVADDVTC